MKTKLRVCIVSAEMIPFAKVGGLADVVGSLSKTLASMGHDVSVFLPRYASIGSREFGLKKIKFNRQLAVRLGPEEKRIDVWECTAKGSRARVYFIGNESFFGRDGIYLDPKTREDYPDNGQRFTFFSKAVLEVIKSLSLHFDVIHCNDHQTGLIPLFLRSEYSAEKIFVNTATLFTIHNLGYQGVYPRELIAQTGLPEELAYPMGPLEFWGKLNFMKAAVVYADLISTVSETYAKEIQTTEEYGFGLQGVLAARTEDLFGVTNGVDYTAWNPSKDRYVPYKYGPGDTGNKVKNKMHLIEKKKLFGLSQNSFLIGIVSRLADQKGFDLLQEVSEEMLSMDIGLVILGTGQQKYHDFFSQLESRYPGKVSLTLAFSERWAHLIEAASDAFLMPSKYEPCGLNQMYSMRYGTIPIVRFTGGLADTVREFDPASEKGTGFVFHEYDERALMEVLKKAYGIFLNKEQWAALLKNAMEEDFSWKRAAQGYVELYRKAIAKKCSAPFADWVSSMAETTL
jgi:starch synthase